MKIRCPWVPADNQLYIDYHDSEWGVPVHNDKRHFEFLILEGAQAGLSWLTVLKRRSGYKKAFANFNPQKVAQFGKRQFNQLMENPAIIRNKLKINSAINNAQHFLEVQKEFGSFDKYIWSFVNHKTIKHRYKALKDYPTYIKPAETLSQDLKTRGFQFVGPTIIYAHMQACGLVNDHTVNCFRYHQV